MSENRLTKAEIDSRLSKKIKIQNYTTQKSISGVQILPLNQILTEDGFFLELFKLQKNNCLEMIANFKPQQISYTSLEPGSIKAWHIHLAQEDIWFVPPDSRLLVGLHDIRENSKTKGNIMRLVLGAHTSSLLYIPRGVAHGCSNTTQSSIVLIYITNKQFDKTRPDEYRLPWDNLGKDFWNVKKG